MPNLNRDRPPSSSSKIISIKPSSQCQSPKIISCNKSRVVGLILQNNHRLDSKALLLYHRPEANQKPYIYVRFIYHSELNTHRINVTSRSPNMLIKNSKSCKPEDEYGSCNCTNNMTKSIKKHHQTCSQV